MEEQYIIENENFTTIVDKEGITLKPKQEENKTIEELRQKLTNYLYSLENYNQLDVEIMKILFK